MNSQTAFLLPSKMPKNIADIFCLLYNHHNYFLAVELH
ncbi:hypothetical protein LACWKB8_0680 [Lactobacillus sp. wkB8]|nr:hypothetical protein LACWKB8_0680 [Lactobacillus sp. wkB8]